MLTVFGYASVLLSLSCVIPYIRDILRHKTQPERASWFIWTVLGVIAFFSQLAKGATDSLWLTVGETVAVSIVFFLSLKYGVGGLTKRDIKALIGAAVGVVLWFITHEATWAIVFVIFVDSIGALLTLVKAYEDPKSETLSTWVISGTSGVFGTLAVGSLNPILLAYPLYIVVANYLTVVAQVLGRRKKNLPLL
ncbi:hypothetical protein BH09PAT1_BH09PAT1_7350 [soil metagenome]